jgi:protein-S-isoprenylcysteine O-methyltransferase Ste14
MMDQQTKTRALWYRGTHGEWYVVVQILLFVLIAFGPARLPGMSEWPAPYTQLAVVAGVALMLVGAALSVGGILRLGHNITALPYPVEGAPLIEQGPYAIVRNPIYSGLIIAAFGWGLWRNGPLTLGYALVLFAFFDVKSRLEERWLAEKFPDYADYQRRVRKLIPWVY